MIKHIVTEVGGIAAVGAISVCLFVAVFSGALLWTFCQKKQFLTAMAALPLSEETAATGVKGENHHD